MAKNRLSHKERFVSFKNNFCPYCGSQGATLDEIERGEGAKGYRGACTNEKCKAENFFSNPKAEEWMQEASS
jgi:hypothetical protein